MATDSVIPISMVQPKLCTAGTLLKASKPNESNDVIAASQTASNVAWMLSLRASAQKIA
jgi:hypothetical protein